MNRLFASIVRRCLQNRTCGFLAITLLVLSMTGRIGAEEPPDGDPIQRACAEAARLLNSNDVAGARDRVLTALRKHPGSPVLYLRLARIHLRLRDATGAHKAAAQALKARGGWPEALLVDAEARVALGDVKGALGSLDAILRAGPRKGHVADLRLARRMLDNRGIKATVAEAARRGLLPIDLPFALAARHKEILELLTRGPGWARTYERRTGHFVVRTDAGQTVADGLSVHLELAHSAYAAILPPLRLGTERPLLVLGFASRTDYVRGMTTLVGHGTFVSATVGMYVPDARCLAVLCHARVESMLPVVYHEAFHACVDARVGRLPRWLDEGLAEALSYRLLGKKAPRWRLPPARVHSLRASVSRSGIPSSANVLALPRIAFGDVRRAPEAYALAWAFADFLLERDARRETHVIRTMLAALREGRTPDAAVKAGLGAAPRDALDEAFARHVHRILGQASRR